VRGVNPKKLKVKYPKLSFLLVWLGLAWLLGGGSVVVLLIVVVSATASFKLETSISAF
jgi:hypothetical protein